MHRRSINDLPDTQRHVLVLGMSTFPFDILDHKKNLYQFKANCMDRSDAHSYKVHSGFGQLEVIPQFIEKDLNERITHLIILATKATLDPLKRAWHVTA